MDSNGERGLDVTNVSDMEFDITSDNVILV